MLPDFSKSQGRNNTIAKSNSKNEDYYDFDFYNKNPC